MHIRTCTLGSCSKSIWLKRLRSWTCKCLWLMPFENVCAFSGSHSMKHSLRSISNAIPWNVIIFPPKWCVWAAERASMRETAAKGKSLVKIEWHAGREKKQELDILPLEKSFSLACAHAHSHSDIQLVIGLLSSPLQTCGIFRFILSAGTSDFLPSGKMHAREMHVTGKRVQQQQQKHHRVNRYEVK